MVGPAVDAATGGAGVRHARLHQRAPLPRLSRESVRLQRFAASPRTTATQRAFSRWPASRGGPGARAEVAVVAVVAASLCAPSLASARLHRRGAGVELGIAGRTLRRRSKEPDRWPRDGADGAAPRPRMAMGVVLIPSTAGARRCQETRLKPALVAAGSSRRGFRPGRSTGPFSSPASSAGSGPSAGYRVVEQSS